MTIETKYNIGDEVWFILGATAKKGEVLEITFTKIEDILTGYYYNVSVGTSHASFYEKQLFPTKEELLKSL